MVLRGVATRVIGSQLDRTAVAVRSRARRLNILIKKTNRSALRWVEGEGEMTGTPRSPWTTEQDKELQALIFSASRVETIAQALHRTPSAVRRRASILRLPMRKIARRRSRFDPPGSTSRG
jgi:hypothetical protein